jgi:hypothetical protein
MKSMSFKPSDLKQNVESEPMKNKVKLAGIAVVMASIASTYATYFGNIVYRSNQLQDKALAGQAIFMTASMYETNLWDARNTLSVLDSKDWKDLKYISAGWADHTYTDGSS